MRWSAVLRGTLAAVIALAALSLPAQAQSPLTAIIEAEGVVPRFTENARVAKNLVPELSARFADSVPAQGEAMEAAARASFHGDEIVAAMERAFKDERSAVPNSAAKAMAAKRDVRDAFDRLDEPAQVAALDEAKALLEKRPDRQAVEHLADLSIAPDLIAERAVTFQRMRLVVEKVLLDGPSSLAGLDAAQRRTLAEHVVRQSRKAPPEEDASRQALRESGRALESLLAARLSAEDVAALVSFYETAEGRTLLDGALQGFREASDQAAERMILAFIARNEQVAKEEGQ